MHYSTHPFSDYDSIEILRSYKSIHSYPAHYHDTFCFSIISEGIFVEDEKIISPNYLLITNPMHVHVNNVYKSLSHSLTTFYINQDIVNYALNSKVDIRFDSIIDKIDVVMAFRLLCADTLICNEQLYSEKIIKTLRMLKPYIIADYPNAIRKNDWVECCQYFIDEHAHEYLTLDQLASKVSQDKFKLIREFKKQVGMTPAQYIILQRVIRAQKSIKSGATLSEASCEAGFYDQSDLTRYFKRFIGTTPRNYQKAFCNNPQEKY